MRRTSAFIALALLGVVLAAYLRVVAGGETFVGRDHLTHTVPAKTFLAESVRGGNVPEWWPAIGMGVPFAANPNHSAAYPPAWIVAALPVPWSIDVLLVLHVWLAGVGAAAFARRLGADPLGAVVAGGVFMVSGMVGSMVVHGGPLLTAAWTPWIAWGADRVSSADGWRERARLGLQLAALQGAQLLAGDPSIAIVSGLLALGVMLARRPRDWRPVAALAGSSCAAAVLAAVALVPALALLGESSRAGGLAFDDATVWSMHPLRALEWVWPRAFGDPNRTSLDAARVVADASGGRAGIGAGWALSLHVGVPALALAACATRKRAWLIVCAVFVVLALGRYTPIYGWYRAVALPERLVRYPEKHLLGALVIVAALAGVGFTRATGGVLSRRARLAVAIAAGLFAVAVVAVGLAGGAIAGALDDRGLRGGAITGEILDAGVGALGAIVLAGAALWAAARRRWAWAGPAAAAVILGHLVAETYAIQPTLDRARVADTPALLRDVSPSPSEPPRLYRPQQLPRATAADSLADEMAAAHDTALENSATRFGFHYFRGYDQGHSARMRAVWEAGARAGQRLLDRFDVELAILPAAMPAVPGFQLVAATAERDVVLVRNVERRPRAFATADWQWMASDDDALAALFTAPMTRVLLVGSGQPAGPAPPHPTVCELRASDPEQLELHCDAPAPGYAVALIAWAPGWSATVDGSPAPIARADVLAMAVPIDRGPHVVHLRYRTPGLRLAAVLSVLAWIVLMLGARILRRGERAMMRV